MTHTMDNTTLNIPVSLLKGVTLDYAVALARGHFIIEDRGLWILSTDKDDWRSVFSELRQYTPTTDWNLTGPLIDEFNICVLAPVIRRISAERHAFPVREWRALIQRDEDEEVTHGRGPDPLTAVCRCFVTYRLGPRVPIPAQLLKDFDLPCSMPEIT